MEPNHLIYSLTSNYFDCWQTRQTILTCLTCHHHHSLSPLKQPSSPPPPPSPRAKWPRLRPVITDYRPTSLKRVLGGQMGLKFWNKNSVYRPPPPSSWRARRAKNHGKRPCLRFTITATDSSPSYVHVLEGRVGHKPYNKASLRTHVYWPWAYHPPIMRLGGLGRPKILTNVFGPQTGQTPTRATWKFSRRIKPLFFSFIISISHYHQFSHEMPPKAFIPDYATRVKLAVEHVRENPGISQRQTCQIYGVTRSTLQARLQDRQSTQVYHANTQWLLTNKKQVLITWIEQMTSLKWLFYIQQFEHMIKKLLMIKSDKTFLKNHYYQKFLKKYFEFSIK